MYFELNALFQNNAWKDGVCFWDRTHKHSDRVLISSIAYFVLWSRINNVRFACYSILISNFLD